MSYCHDIMQLIGTSVDALGVMIIVIGAVVATAHFVGNRRRDFGSAYRSYRQGLGRAIRSLALASRRRPEAQFAVTAAPCGDRALGSLSGPPLAELPRVRIMYIMFNYG